MFGFVSVIIHFSYHFWEVINTKKRYVDDNKGFQSGTVVKNPSANAGDAGDPRDARDMGLILGSGRSMEKQDWQVTVLGVVKSWT